MGRELPGYWAGCLFAEGQAKMSEPPVTTPKIKVPRWTRTDTLWIDAVTAFQDVYLSFGWAVGVVGAAILIASSLRPAHHPLRVRHLGAAPVAVLGLSFGLTFLFSYFFYYTGPERKIEARLRAVAASSGLRLTRRANGMAGTWIWTRFPSVSMQIQRHMGDRCWTLSSDRDSSKLVMVTHTSRSDVHRSGARHLNAQYEVAVVAFFQQVAPAGAALGEMKPSELEALGFKAEPTEHGVCVSRLQFCHWRKGQSALDLITVERLLTLLRLMQMRG